MQYRYTLSGGYDRLIKKKVEKGTLFAVPLAVLAIVGLAALTSTTTSGPGIGSSSKGNSGQSTVTKTFQPTAANGQLDSGGGATSSGSTTSSSTAQGSSGTTSGSRASTASLQPTTTTKSVATSSSSTPTTSTSSTPMSSGGTSTGSSGGSTTLLPGATPVTVCVGTKTIDPLTGQEICIN